MNHARFYIVLVAENGDAGVMPLTFSNRRRE
jgi:hypothetical protein